MARCRETCVARGDLRPGGKGGRKRSESGALVSFTPYHGPRLLFYIGTELWVRGGGAEKACQSSLELPKAVGDLEVWPKPDG